MRRLSLYFQLLFCLLIGGAFLFFYIEKENGLIELRLTIPKVQKEVKILEEENQRLQYAIDIFESPVHLMQLLRQPEFGHLKYPQKDKTLTLRE